MTVNSPGPTPLSPWLRRLWPVYCFLAILVNFGYALYDSYQIDGDAVSYMDIGDLMRAHNWPGIINGYWNPLYPAFLALGHAVFHPTRYTELHAYYMVNFGIFILEMLAVVAFADALIKLRDLRESVSTASGSFPFFLGRYTLRYLGIAILVISTQRELSVGKVRPDALLQAFLLFAIAALFRHLATAHLRYAALMGLALGLAYLTKSFAFLFTLLCVLALVAFRIFWQRHAPRRVAVSALLVLICFSIVAGPYIAALSKQKDRFDFGDSGNLNYVWFVGGTEKMHLQQDQTNLFGAAEVHLIHPEKQLLKDPPIFSYKQLPYGTYPDWFDTSFFNERIKAHMNPRLQIIVIGAMHHAHPAVHVQSPRSLGATHPLLFLGARLRLDWTISANAFWLRAVSPRHRHPLHLRHRQRRGPLSLPPLSSSILLPLFAASRISPAVSTSSARTAASAAVALLALLAVGESARIVGQLRRDLVFVQYPTGWYDRDTFRAAHALNDLGVGPGDTIACIGTRACLYDHYWARLAGVRILTEIYVPDAPSTLLSPPSLTANRPTTSLRREGAKVLVGYFDPGLMTGTTPVSAGWRELDGTHFYALPLNLSDNASSTALTPTHH